MSQRVLFEPEASDELQEAALWYEAQHPGLGLTLLAAVDRVVAHLMAWPESGTPVPAVPPNLSVRQMPVARFPYHVVYLVVFEDLRVLAVAHDRRRPGYWRSRAEP